MAQAVRVTFNNLATSTSLAAGIVVTISQGVTIIDTQTTAADGSITSSLLGGTSQYTLSFSGTGAPLGTHILYTNGALNYNVSTGNAGSNTTVANYKIYSVTDGGVHTVAATYIIGIKNNSSAQQIVTGTLYDSVSGANGTIIETIGEFLATQVVTYPAPGLSLNSGGFTIQLSGVPNGNGVQVLYI
jgi:hypothetical protein